MKSLFADPSALTYEQKDACRDALRKIAEDSLPRVLRRAFEAAHQANQLSAADFWRNLFVNTNICGSCDPLLRRDNRRNIVPNSPPQKPYHPLDLQCCLKFLYFGGGRSRDGQNVLPDTGYVLQYFGCSTTLGQYAQLDTPYGMALNKMMKIRNGKLCHPDEDTILDLTLDDLLEFRDVMQEVLEPFCKKNWSCQEEAKSLSRKIDKEFYRSLQPILCNSNEIYKEANIPADKHQEAERMLELMGLSIQNGTISLPCHPVEFVKQLKAIFSLDHLSLELKAAMLASILPKNIPELMDTFLPEEEFSLKDLSIEALEERADNGDTYAQGMIGFRYLDVDDNQKAISYFLKAANAGNAAAQGMLGSLLTTGEGKWDPYEGVYWLKESASQGNTTAMYMLGDCYERGYGISMDKKKAYEKYDQAARQGDKDALLAKGRCLIYGIGTEADEEEGLFLYKQGEREKNPEAFRLLGQYYARRNKNRALEYYQKAADAGDADGKFLLYTELKERGSVSKEVLENLLEEAADDGCCDAMYEWGILHQDLFIIRDAAQRGHLKSCEKIGSQRSSKIQNQRRAIEYLQIAQQMGSDKAISLKKDVYERILELYLAGETSEKNKYVDEAIEWLYRRIPRDGSRALTIFYDTPDTPYYNMDKVADCYMREDDNCMAAFTYFRMAKQFPKYAEHYEELAFRCLKSSIDPTKSYTYVRAAETLSHFHMRKEVYSYYKKAAELGDPVGEYYKKSLEYTKENRIFFMHPGMYAHSPNAANYLKRADMLSKSDKLIDVLMALKYYYHCDCSISDSFNYYESERHKEFSNETKHIVNDPMVRERGRF